ncbi:hypothetical protein R0K19_28485, partial [Bacillus sp. SIMBA_161]
IAYSGSDNDHIFALNEADSTGDLIIDLAATITLGNGQTLTGQGNTVNVSAASSIQNGVDVAASNATVNVAAGDYDAG